MRLTTLFNAIAAVASHGHLLYAAMYPADASKDSTVTQASLYTTTKRVIIGVAIMQVSSDLTRI